MSATAPDHTPGDRRGRDDACPGTLRLHEAADGPLARIRLPGGLLTPAQLRCLAEAARELAGGALELTSRGNVQLRAVRDAAALADRLGEAGLLPSAAHERVRNIVASPLSGRVGGRADVRGLVGALDTRLRENPALADLPGRVLFTLDDGRGDVTALAGDIGAHALDDGRFALILAGAHSGVELDADQIVDVVLAAAHAFARLRESAWRLAELADGPARVLDRLGLPRTPNPEPLPADAVATPIGWLDQDDGLVALGAGVRFGSLDARTAELLAVPERPVVVTPWRGVVLCDLDEYSAEQVVRVLAPMGLIFDAASPWLTVTACAGRPGCARAHTDVRADTAAAVAAGELPTTGRQHWSACERRCGRPRGAVTDVIAEPNGTYRVVSNAANR